MKCHGVLEILSLLLVIRRVEPYRPLVMIHGVTSNYQAFDTIVEYVEWTLPGLLTFPIDAFNDDSSYVDLDIQVNVFSKRVEEITRQYGPITLLGYSQGGVIARAVVEKSSNPNITTLISLSSPTAGQYGIPPGDDIAFPGQTKEDIYKDCYNLAGQIISVCDYWNDPEHQTLYLEKNHFLPKYNNLVPHRHAQTFKANFASLQQLVLVGGPDDETIMPWQSAQFGFYDENLDIIPYNQQVYYLNDSFGLQTLDREGRIAFCTHEGISHGEWVRSPSVFAECILPWLF